MSTLGRKLAYAPRGRTVPYLVANHLALRAFDHPLIERKAMLQLAEIFGLRHATRLLRKRRRRPVYN